MLEDGLLIELLELLFDSLDLKHNTREEYLYNYKDNEGWLIVTLLMEYEKKLYNG